MTSRPEAVGILAIEVYTPALYVDQVSFAVSALLDQSFRCRVDSKSRSGSVLRRVHCELRMHEQSHHRTFGTTRSGIQAFVLPMSHPPSSRS